MYWSGYASFFKAMGVSEVIVVDVMEKRLQKAMELGATAVINGKEEDTVQRIMELTGGRGFDLGIETAGSQITASQLIKGANKGATIVFVGYSASGEMTLPMGMALDKELTFKTVFRYRNIYPMGNSGSSFRKNQYKRNCYRLF